MPQAQKEDYQILHEGNEEVLHINANSWNYAPSVEDNPYVMAYILDKLAEIPSISRIILHQRRNFGYTYDQTQMLVEIAQLYSYIIRSKTIVSLSALGFQEEHSAFYTEKLQLLHYLVYTLLRSDPISCFVELKRLIREEKILLEKENQPPLIDARQRYIELLHSFYERLHHTKLLAIVSKDLEGLSIGDRSLYKNVFRATITPNFLFTRLMAQPPLNGEQIELYTIGTTQISVFKLPHQAKLLYHVNPIEFQLTDDEVSLVELARNVLAEHKPQEQEFLEPERLRKTFYNIGRDLLTELIETKHLDIAYPRIELLANILVRYTVGFGLIEVLLEDEKIQDIAVNSPVGDGPLYVVHQDFGECVTNILPSKDDAESWATKLRLLSGRPLDEANPVLDTELIVPKARSRVSVMTTPLSPTGLAYAFRRHRDKPWTLPLFIQKRMLTPLAAGLISFFVDGARTMLIAGTRSSGKTSLLSAVMIEIMRKHRIMTIEDTLEIPVDSFKKLGYNIQHMKVRSALMSGGVEMSADEGIRTSLRFGDSSLIVGEVRSVEAKALYEAMRVGALANVVAGTIHGASPYAVYDRVVNDLNVPKTSFKATDIILVANPILAADGLRKWRRLLQITEVKKHWQNDPLAEGGFMDLMKYDVDSDTIAPTQDLKNGESDTLKAIAGNIRSWAGNWDAVWENILLRGKIKETLVHSATQHNMLELLEAEFVVKSNDVFHIISDSVNSEVGSYDNKRIYTHWESWLKREMKTLKI